MTLTDAVHDDNPSQSRWIVIINRDRLPSSIAVYCPHDVMTTMTVAMARRAAEKLPGPGLLGRRRRRGGGGGGGRDSREEGSSAGPCASPLHPREEGARAVLSVDWRRGTGTPTHEPWSMNFLGDDFMGDDFTGDHECMVSWAGPCGTSPLQPDSGARVSLIRCPSPPPPTKRVGGWADAGESGTRGILLCYYQS